MVNGQWHVVNAHAEIARTSRGQWLGVTIRMMHVRREDLLRR